MADTSLLSPVRAPRAVSLALLAVLAACTEGTSAPDDAGASTAQEPVAPARLDAAAAPEARESRPGPRIEFPVLVHDFGQVSDVEPLRYAFAFTNAGDQRLIVTDIEASCGCTTPTLEKQSYEPGENGEIGAVWEAKGFGPQRKTITVTTNGQPERVTLTLAAELEPFVSFDPAYLSFGQVEMGSERILSARLVSSDESLEVVGVTSTYPHLSAHVVDDPEGGGRLLEAMLLPSAPWGAFNGQLLIDVRGRPDPAGELREHRAQVGAGGMVHGELVMDSTLFAVGRVDPGASFRSSIEITRPDGEPFEVVEARLEQATPATMSLRVERIEGAAVTGHRLVLEGESGPHLGLIRGTAVVRTDLESEPERRLQIAGMVRELKTHEH